jgi:hypothetical protein
MKSQAIPRSRPVPASNFKSLANEPAQAAAPPDESLCLRRLQFNELVSTGDLVMNEQREFEPWEGPNGFRADSFVKPIYRRKDDRSILAIRPE